MPVQAGEHLIGCFMKEINAFCVKSGNLETIRLELDPSGRARIVFCSGYGSSGHCDHSCTQLFCLNQDLNSRLEPKKDVS